MSNDNLPNNKLPNYGISSLFVFFAVLIPVFLLFLVASVPVSIEKSINYKLPFIGFTWQLEKDMHLVFIAVYGGILGGLIHGMSSLIHHGHKENVKKSFIIWYLSRPFLGSSLALAVYFLFRGGLITNGNVEMLNPYGIAAISIMIGLGTRQITRKLGDVLNTFMNTPNER